MYGFPDGRRPAGGGTDGKKNRKRRDNYIRPAVEGYQNRKIPRIHPPQKTVQILRVCYQDKGKIRRYRLKLKKKAICSLFLIKTTKYSVFTVAITGSIAEIYNRNKVKN